MRRTASTLLVMLVLMIVRVRAGAQASPRLDAARVSARGELAQDFVPGGWKIAAHAEGDLNGDKLPDQVLELVTAETPDDRSFADVAPADHALLILLAESGGKLRRAGLATKLLAADVSQYSLDLTIKNGVLIVQQDYGMSDVFNLTHRFRYEAAAARFLLIGEDFFAYTRPLMDDTVRISVNYLTGIKLTTTGRFHGGVVGRETTKREQIARKKIYFEEVDESNRT